MDKELKAIKRRLEIIQDHVYQSADEVQVLLTEIELLQGKQDEQRTRDN